MQSQLWPQQDGFYFADFMFDDATSGFEDILEETMFYRRIDSGQTFAEYGEPEAGHLAGNPMAVFNRFASIEPRNVCAHLTATLLPGDSGLRIYVRPYGPFKERMVNDMIHNPTGYGLKFRLHEEETEGAIPVVKNVYTLDFIKLN